MAIKDKLRLSARVSQDERQPRAVGELHDEAHVDAVLAQVRQERSPEAVAPNPTDHGGSDAEAREPGRDIGWGAAELAPEEACDGLRTARACLEDIPENLPEADDLQHQRHRRSKPAWAASARSMSPSTVSACPSVASFGWPAAKARAPSRSSGES